MSNERVLFLEFCAAELSLFGSKMLGLTMQCRKFAASIFVKVFSDEVFRNLLSMRVSDYLFFQR